VLLGDRRGVFQQQGVGPYQSPVVGNRRHSLDQPRRGSTIAPRPESHVGHLVIRQIEGRKSFHALEQLASRSMVLVVGILA
jgi:hypothetical protein